MLGWNRRRHCAPVLYFTLVAILVVSALGSGRAAAQFTTTEIIDAAGNTYVTGALGDSHAATNHGRDAIPATIERLHVV